MTLYLFTLALGATLVGLMPTLIGGGRLAAIAMAAAGLPLSVSVAYLTTPETVTPMFGVFGLLALGGIAVGIAWNLKVGNRLAFSLGLWTGGIGSLAYAALQVWGSPMFQAADYAGMAGTIETRDWTKDVQPKDPAHMRLVPIATARYEASKAMAQKGPIRSQFSVSEEPVTPQVIDGRLTYVLPLTFVSFGVWQSTGGLPGWVEVDAEDPASPARLVETNRAMRVSPDAFFGDNLVRVLREAGVTEEIQNLRLRLDKRHSPHWVSSLSRPIHASIGTRMTGVVIVDPFTGAVERHGMDDLPDLIDVAYPADVVSAYLADRGNLSGGWWNSFFAKAGLTRPETTRLVEGTEGRPIGPPA